MSGASCRSSSPAALWVPREELFARTRTVAVLPLRTARGTGIGETAREIEPMIERELASLGFEVIPAEAYRTLWDREASALEGTFDPMTGELDRAKFDAVHVRSLAQLARQRIFEAVLVPTIELVSAPFWGGYARWDGVTERLQGSGEMDVQLEDYDGTLKALSLRIEIIDRQRNPLYEQRAGLQLLGRIEAGGVADIAPGEVLTDAERNRAAVLRALAPLRGD